MLLCPRMYSLFFGGKRKKIKIAFGLFLNSLVTLNGWRSRSAANWSGQKSPKIEETGLSSSFWNLPPTEHGNSVPLVLVKQARRVPMHAHQAIDAEEEEKRRGRKGAPHSHGGKGCRRHCHRRRRRRRDEYLYLPITPARLPPAAVAETAAASVARVASLDRCVLSRRPF